MFGPASKGARSCGVLAVIVSRRSFSPARGPQRFGIRFSYSAASQTPDGPPGVFSVHSGHKCLIVVTVDYWDLLPSLELSPVTGVFLLMVPMVLLSLR